MKPKQPVNPTRKHAMPPKPTKALDRNMYSGLSAAEQGYAVHPRTARMLLDAAFVTPSKALDAYGNPRRYWLTPAGRAALEEERDRTPQRTTRSEIARDVWAKRRAAKSQVA